MHYASNARNKSLESITNKVVREGCCGEQLYKATNQGTSGNTSELSGSNLGVSKYSKTKCKNF